MSAIFQSSRKNFIRFQLFISPSSNVICLVYGKQRNFKGLLLPINIRIFYWTLLATSNFMVRHRRVLYPSFQFSNPCVPNYSISLWRLNDPKRLDVLCYSCPSNTLVNLVTWIHFGFSFLNGEAWTLEKMREEYFRGMFTILSIAKTKSILSGAVKCTDAKRKLNNQNFSLILY